MIAAGGWALAAASAAAAICGPVITDCCTVASAGVFFLANDLSTGVGGGDCIDVAAVVGGGQGVVIQMNAFTISSGFPGSGVGINVFPSATGTVVDGCSDNLGCFGKGAITGFATGILDQARHAVFNDIITDFSAHAGVRAVGADLAVFNDMEVFANGTNGMAIVSTKAARIRNIDNFSNGRNGIKLDSSTGSFVDDSDADSNLKNGVVLFQAHSNALDNVNASSNGKAGFKIAGSSWNSTDFLHAGSNVASGIYVGCSPGSVPVGFDCPTLLGFADGVKNSIVDTRNSGANFNAFGIALDRGATQSIVFNNSALSNSVLDLDDENPACDTNIWEENVFGTSSPGGCTSGTSGGSDL